MTVLKVRDSLFFFILRMAFISQRVIQSLMISTFNVHLPSGRLPASRQGQASSPQRNCAFFYLTSFDFRLRRNRKSQYCLCSDWYFFFVFWFNETTSTPVPFSLRRRGAGDEVPWLSCRLWLGSQLSGKTG